MTVAITNGIMSQWKRITNLFPFGSFFLLSGAAKSGSYWPSCLSYQANKVFKSEGKQCSATVPKATISWSNWLSSPRCRIFDKGFSWNMQRNHGHKHEVLFHYENNISFITKGSAITSSIFLAVCWVKS